MAKNEKAPAFQWYPKDMLTDKRVMGMTLVQEAIYRRLLDFAWLENGLDNDMQLLASYAKLGEQPEVFSQHWKIVKKCFVLVNGKFKNNRQEKERLKQKKFRIKQQKAAQVRWGKGDNSHLKTDATASFRHASGNALLSSSSSPSSTSKINQLNPLNFKDEEIDELRRLIAAKMGYGLNSEACEHAWREFIIRIDRFVRKKRIIKAFEYALTSVQNMREPVAA